MTGPRSRRANLNEEEISKMRELETAGKKRVEIAKEMQLHPSCVTRHLGTRKKKEETTADA